MNKKRERECKPYGSRSCFLFIIIWTSSSVGQSSRLITDRSRVRVPGGPVEGSDTMPFINDAANVGKEFHPVQHVNALSRSDGSRRRNEIRTTISTEGTRHALHSTRQKLGD